MREVVKIIKGMPATDGAGVELTRVIGQPSLPMLDPFLLLDVFRSDNPQDYIAGFPPHPHRGFETVTYLLKGKMRHKDNAGHEGVIESGGIQWMTAGKGIIHSEMPEQENGLLEGFQLWVNLPATHKMDDPFYQEIPAAEIPLEKRDNGVEVRVITGHTSQGTTGPVVQPLTQPLYLDVTIPANQVFTEQLSESHNAFIYVIEGAVSVAGNKTKIIEPTQLAILSEGSEIKITSEDKPARILLVSGYPLNEPIARKGPFVMNTDEEIEQAFADYRNGTL